MGSNKKQLLIGLAVVAFGISTSASVFASAITDSYATGDTLTATQLTNIKTHANDTNTRLGTTETNVTNLQQNVAAGSCGTGMTRVGPSCVDNARQGPSISWNTAVNTCRALGKRLLTPSEYIAAKNLGGTITGMTTNNEFEWVDHVTPDATVDANPAGGMTGRMNVGYIGPGTNPDVPADGDIFFGNNVTYDVGFAGVFFRCAR